MIGGARVPPSAPPEGAPATAGGLSPADARAVAVLAGLTAVVAWNRFAFDVWLARYDVFTQFLPWYAHLGERLRALDVPGWNPHLFSGTPFAGHPLTGWTYLPAMLAFPLLPVLPAFKAMVAAQLAVAGLATYAFARVLGMGPVAGLAAAVVYAFGPFLEWNTYCCLQFALFATWVPLALLGVELALRALRWRDRLAPWFATGFALSQMMAGWVGEGWFYALLLVAAYLGYRVLLSPPRPGPGLGARLTAGTATGCAVLGLGLALGAAGILPRLAVNAQSNLAGGDYALLGRGGIQNPPWELDYLLVNLMGMGTGYPFRAAGFGGAVLVLALLAPLVARQRFAVPFFAGLTLVALTLTLDTTPLHRLVYLIPRYRALHEHDPWRVVALAAIGPAMLSGATVEALAVWRGRRRFLPIVVAPLLVMAVVAAALGRAEGVVGWAPLVAAATTTVIIAIIAAAPRDGMHRGAIGRVARWATALVVVVAFVQPTGLELSGSWLGWPRDPRWERRWQPDPRIARALATEVAESDPGGAGDFLRARLAEYGPFRYVGYGGARSYMGRRFEPNVQAILVNGRPMFLDLYEIQGYDPIQLARYVEFMAALNGRAQGYHSAFLLPSGVRSPLLDLLSVRYVLVDATLPQDRDDIAALTAGRRLVFRNELVAVYEIDPAPPHAWIVHDVRAVARGEALPLLASGAVDPWRTALVEGDPPAVGHPADPAAEAARVTRYEPDAVEIATNAAAPGLLVVSEVYETGWRAYVDGEEVEVLPTHHVLRGVPIPAGEHVVALRYEPLSLRLGLPISGVATLAMLAVFAAEGWTRLRSRASRPGRTRGSGSRTAGTTSRARSRRAGRSPGSSARGGEVLARASRSPEWVRARALRRHRRISQTGGTSS